MSLLVHFVGMEEELWDKFLMEVKVGLLQRRLVRKVLRDAREGWERGVRKANGEMVEL